MTAALLFVIVPVALALFFGVVATWRTPPNVYGCRRCGIAFRRQPYKRFPRACPSCGAHDWAHRAS